MPPRKGQPETLPHVHIEAGRLTLRQEGRRDDLVVDGVTADLRDEGSRLVLTGTVADPLWEGWSAAAEVDRRTGVGTLTLDTPQVRVTQEMLTRLPFVAARTWEQVQVESDTPVVLTLRWEPEAESVRYRAALRPREVTLFIRAVGLRVERAGGGLLIEDGLMRLEGVRGEAADGTGAEGILDFRGDPARLELGVRAERLDVARLPKSWKLPPGTAGRLSGELTFRLPLDGDAAPEGEERRR